MKILGVDFGDSRTGYAISDVLGFAANVLPAFKSKSIKNVADYTSELAEKNGAEKIILGFPKNMNGTLGPRAEKTKRLAEMLNRGNGGQSSRAGTVLQSPDTVCRATTTN